MTCKIRSIIHFFVFITILFNVLTIAGVACGRDIAFETGIAVTPRHFPAHTAEDLDGAFKLASELGQYSVFIFQWHELNLDIARLMLQKSTQANLTPVLGISPTSLDQGRKELDIPAALRQKAGSFISFANPVIRHEFVNTAKNLAKLEPPYLCLATEINFLALQRPDEYLHFVSLYKEAYHAVKKISSQTKVFVSFQWEWVRILDAKEIHKVKEHSKVINIFKPELDQVGLTTYPAAFHDSPAQLPLDYYAWVNHHIDKRDRVLFMETGWPTSGSGNEAEQLAYIQRLPELLKNVNTSIVAWALLHDVNLPEFDANLNTVGVLKNDGTKKPGLDAFKTLNK